MLDQPLIASQDPFEDFSDVDENIYVRKKEFPIATVTLSITGFLFLLSVVLSIIQRNLNFIKIVWLSHAIGYAAIICSSAFFLGVFNFLSIKLLFRKNSCSCNLKRKEEEIEEIISTIFTKYVFTAQTFNDFYSIRQLSNTNEDKIMSLKAIAASQQARCLIDEALNEFFDSNEGATALSYGFSREMIEIHIFEAINRINDLRWFAVSEFISHHSNNSNDNSKALLQYFLMNLNLTKSTIAEEGVNDLIGANVNWVVVWAVVLGAVFGAVHIIVFQLVK